MAFLESHLDRSSGDAVRRHDRMTALVAELRERAGLVAAGGGERPSSGTVAAASWSPGADRPAGRPGVAFSS